VTIYNYYSLFNYENDCVILGKLIMGCVSCKIGMGPYPDPKINNNIAEFETTKPIKWT